MWTWKSMGWQLKKGLAISGFEISFKYPWENKNLNVDSFQQNNYLVYIKLPMMHFLSVNIEKHKYQTQKIHSMSSETNLQIYHQIYMMT